MGKEQVELLEGKLKTAQRFDSVLTDINRFSMLAGVLLFVTSGRPTEVALGMVTTGVVGLKLDLISKRRVQKLIHGLEVERVDDYALLLYPDIRNGWIEEEGEIVIDRLENRPGPAH